MFQKPIRPDGNALVSRLPVAQRRLILDHAEFLALPSGKVIADPDQSIAYVYFPLSAVISILSVLSDGSGVETGIVGYEGMVPLAAFHDVEYAPEQIVAQVPGDALRMPVDVFRSIAKDSPDLRQRLHRFSQALFSFAAQTSGCNRKHSVVQRCARWLLLTHDRVPGDEFALTHLFLAQMLGVRRSSVTIAAEALRAAGAISYSRGKVRVVSRETLHARACECYGIVRTTYDRLLLDVPGRSVLAGVELSRDELSLTHSGDGPLSASGDGFPRKAEPIVPEQASGSPEELSAALEQLQVAEEELRAQVEALQAMQQALQVERLAAETALRYGQRVTDVS